jgi:uncharacterized RDD family membrane protein YckC
MKYAGAFRRAASYVIDDLFLSIPEVLVLLVGGTNLLMRLVEFSETVDPNATFSEVSPLIWELLFGYVPLLLISVIIGLGYTIILPYYYDGKTLGRQIVGTKVVRMDGQRLTISQLILREVVGKALFWVVTLGIGLLVDWYLVVATPTKQAVCDRMANTLVIELDGESVPESYQGY